MLWVAAIHVIAIISWFAGLFYLPRLFVYHAMSTDAISIDRFKIMERRLFWAIMTPSAVLSLITGTWLLISYAWQANADLWWLKVKLILVAALFVYHFYCWRYMTDFKFDKNQYSHVFYRWFNEVPTIILITIIILAIVKPF